MPVVVVTKLFHGKTLARGRYRGTLYHASATDTLIGAKKRTASTSENCALKSKHWLVFNVIISVSVASDFSIYENRIMRHNSAQ